jgi:hypothetical protein
MYLVLNFLKVISAVEHTESVSEYRLILDPTAIVETALKKRQEACSKSGPQLIETLLNRYGPEFLTPLHATRLAAFMRVTKDAR